MSNSKPFLVRLFQAIQRRIRHQRILFTARSKSNNAVSDAKQLDSVLVLCYGNIYRSPLVEYLLKEELSGETIDIRSAGFHDKEGRRCVEEYQQLLSLRGYDLSSHQSSKVTQDDLDWSDIIIIMDRKNWDLLNQMDQSAVKKIVWIGAFSHDLAVEVVDPYGMGVEATENVISQLEECVADITHKICEMKSISEATENAGSDA
jgi:protein-tyrosine phosphatase